MNSVVIKDLSFSRILKTDLINNIDIYLYINELEIKDSQCINIDGDLRILSQTINEELTKKTSSGKKIDFILQELFRESNTLAVKIDDSKLKNYALDMKLIIEEMREQTQNVE